jgi:hypothetical protein
MRGLVWCAVLAALAFGLIQMAEATPPISTGDRYRDTTIGFSMLDSLIQGLGPGNGSTAPDTTVCFGKSNSASGRDSVMVVNANSFSAMWNTSSGTTGPTFYFYGTGIGVSSRDSLVGSLIGPIGSIDMKFADLDSVKWVAPGVTTIVTGWVKGW